MKEGWKYVKIENLFSNIKNGANIKQTKGAKGVPITRIETLSNGVFNTSRLGYADIFDVEPYSNYILNDGDILMSHINSMEHIGRAVAYHSYCDGPLIHGMNLLRLVPVNINPDYCIYYFKTQLFKNDILSNTHKSVNQASFNTRSLKQIKIPVPPLSEQQSIVTYLDTSFSLIDSLAENAKKALENAKALFQAELKKLMEKKEGWEEKKLNTICRVINGRAYLKPEMLSEGKYKILRVGNFFTNDKWYYSDLELEEDKYCENGDLLYAWSASFGPKIWNGDKVIYHYHIWKIECYDDVDKKYMYYWLDSDELKKQAMKNLHGATMNHITKGIMENCLVSFPTLSEQQKIVQTLDTLSQYISQLEQNYNKTLYNCQALKQALLRETFE